MPRKHKATQRRRPEKRTWWGWLRKPLTFQLAVVALKIIAMICRGWGGQ